MRAMPKTLAGIFAVLFVGLASAADLPKSKWPTLPAKPPEKVTPQLAVFTVKDGEYFLIERDTPAIVIGSPDGLVSVTYRTNDKECPILMMGKFAGSGGKEEEREVKSKFIIRIKPVRSGRCEILVIPHGVAKETDIERKTVDVDAGDGAQPPPDDPVDPPPTKPTKAYFLIVRPDGPASPEFVRIFSDPAWLELTKAGHTVKEMTLTESQAVFTPKPGTTSPLPFVVTLDTANKKVLAGPVGLPTTSDGILKLKDGLK